MADELHSQVVDRAALLRGVRSVVVKIGTNALTDGAGRLDTGLIGHFAEQVAALESRKIQVKKLRLDRG
jgi:glutamate 5-kinase